MIILCNLFDTGHGRCKDVNIVPGCRAVMETEWTPNLLVNSENAKIETSCLSEDQTNRTFYGSLSGLLVNTELSKMAWEKMANQARVYCIKNVL